MTEVLESSEKVFFNADLRKSNANLRRFIIGSMCDHLRVICENLRLESIFQRLLSKFIICTLFLFIFGSNCFSETIKIDDLINNNKKYDGQMVTVEGEAIGHLMQRGKFTWLNINDKTNAIGVWAEYSLLQKVKFLGRHAVVGDWIKVSGIFNSHCPMHGGDTDIHADEVKILKNGSIRGLSHEPKKVKVLISLTGLLACLYTIKISKKMRSRSMKQ